MVRVHGRELSRYVRVPLRFASRSRNESRFTRLAVAGVFKFGGEPYDRLALDNPPLNIRALRNAALLTARLVVHCYVITRRITRSLGTLVPSRQHGSSVIRNRITVESAGEGGVDQRSLFVDHP